MDYSLNPLPRNWHFAVSEPDQINEMPPPKSLVFHPARVPGSSVLDLQRLGELPSSNHPDFEARYRRFHHCDFVYRCRFDCPSAVRKRHVWLCFDGIDTVADCFLNGQRLGHVENAYRRHAFRVSKLLQPCGNDLVVILRSPLRFARQRREQVGLQFPAHLDLPYMYIRKPAFSFFWDWAPEMPLCGIHGPIYLEAYDHARIIDYHLRYRIEDGRVSGTVALWTTPGDLLQVEVALGDQKFRSEPFSVSGPDDRVELLLSEAPVTVPIRLENVELWYPNGLGRPHLYPLTLTLKKAGGGPRLHQIVDKVGFRTIEILQDPREDGGGRRFRFQVNGKPLFARGYNWVPADISFATLTPRRYRHLLGLAHEGRVNMLRVWGGGFYEHDFFYRFCDQYGILVWQDAMFACAYYPDNDEPFMDNVRAELVEQVSRLRNHPCVALWCGENECHWGHESWWPEFRQQHGRFFGERIYHQILPGILQRLDPGRLYWPGSPYSPTPGIAANAESEGDHHFWSLHTHCGDFSEYRSNHGSFISETGIQSFPAIRTTRGMVSRKDAHVQALALERRNHFESPAKNERLLKFAAALYRLPERFDSVVFLTHLAQAWYLRTAVEHWRTRQFDCGGVLIWQCNDCWPTISWSVVDYFGRPLAAFYALRRAFASELVVFKQAVDMRYDLRALARGDLYLVTDVPDGGERRIVVRHCTLAGERLQEQSWEVRPSRAVTYLHELYLEAFEHHALDSVLQVELLRDGSSRYQAVYPLMRPKHMRLSRPVVRLQAVDDRTVAVQADRYVHGLELYHPRREVIFDDNAFDLMPGERKLVHADRPVEVRRLRWRCYFHSSVRDD